MIKKKDLLEKIEYLEERIELQSSNAAAAMRKEIRDDKITELILDRMGCSIKETYVIKAVNENRKYIDTEYELIKNSVNKKAEC